MYEYKIKAILTEQYATDVLDNDSTNGVRVLMEYDEEIHRHLHENRGIRGSIETLFGELCAMHVFQPVTIEFKAPNVTYEFSVSGEWTERYEPGTGKETIELKDVMTRIFDSGEVMP